MTYSEYKCSLSILMRTKAGTIAYKKEFSELLASYVRSKRVAEFNYGDDVKCDFKMDSGSIRNVNAKFKKFKVDVRSGELVPVVYFSNVEKPDRSFHLIGMTNLKTNERFVPEITCDAYDMKW